MIWSTQHGSVCFEAIRPVNCKRLNDRIHALPPDLHFFAKYFFSSLPILQIETQRKGHWPNPSSKKTKLFESEKTKTPKSSRSKNTKKNVWKSNPTEPIPQAPHSRHPKWPQKAVARGWSSLVERQFCCESTRRLGKKGTIVTIGLLRHEMSWNRSLESKL